MKSWVKLYTEINHDPKLLTLPWAQRAIWTALLALAGEMDKRDPETELETGELDTIEYTAIRIRCDQTEFSEAVTALTERGMVEERDGVLYLPNYAKRQEVAPSHQRPAQRDRQREHRAGVARNKPVTTSSQPVTTPDTDTDSDTETDEKQGGAGEPAADAQIGVVFQTWQDMNPRAGRSILDTDTLSEMIDEYGAEPVRVALVKANKAGKPTLAYAEGILRNDRQGKGKPRASPGGNGNGPPKRETTYERSKRVLREEMERGDTSDGDGGLGIVGGKLAIEAGRAGDGPPIRARPG